MILDLGCGTPSRFHSYLQGEGIIHLDIERNAFHQEITADGCLLPFQDQTFRLVYASNIMEHVSHPAFLLEEIQRVCAERAIIKVPNGAFYKHSIEADGHIYSWNKHSLRHLLQLYFPKVSITETIRWTIPDAKWPIRKLHTIKFYATGWLTSFNELTAVCHV